MNITYAVVYIKCPDGVTGYREPITGGEGGWAAYCSRLATHGLDTSDETGPIWYPPHRIWRVVMEVDEVAG